VGSDGPLCTLVKQVFWCFPHSKLQLSSLVGNLAFSLFDGGAGALQLVRHSGECWASVHLGRQAFWCYSLSSKLQLSSLQGRIWCLCSLMEKWKLSCGQAQWEVLGIFFALGKQFSSHPQNGRLPLSGGAEFSLFDRAVGGSPMGGLDVNAGPLCSVEREASWCQQNSKVWSLRFTCMCGGRLWP
jgi:hypothetical protein